MLCEGDYLSQIEKVAALKPKAIILREKHLSVEEYRDLCKEVKRICNYHQVELFVHTYIDVANELGINVHQIYDAIGCGKLHYSDTYINKSYTPIVEVDKNNNIIDFFTTIKNGAEKYNLNPGSLASSLLEGRHDFGHHIWYYAKDLA